MHEVLGLESVASVHGTKLRVWLRLLRALLQLLPVDTLGIGPFLSSVNRLLLLRSDDESVVRL